MYSVLLLALWGIAPFEREEPAWLMDYALARKLSQTEKKPIAVFVGSGATGWNDLSREGKIGKVNDRLLAKSYVCLYLDMASEEGGRLARAFELRESRGVVISDSKGELQAFRHEGNLPNENLTYYLEFFSNPDLIVLHTETNPPERNSPAVESTSSTTIRSC